MEQEKIHTPNSSAPLAVYRASRRWKIFSLVLVPPLMALFGWVGCIPFLDNSLADVGRTIFLLAISIGMNAVIVLGVLSLFKTRIEIYLERIGIKSLFKQEEILYSEIKGFRRLQDSYIVFIPQQDRRKKVKIGTYLESMDLFMEWVSKKFENLDEADFLNDQKTILQNQEFGRNIEERAWRLESARKWARFLHVCTIGVSVWGLFYPHPYKIAITTLACFPVISLVSVFVFAGLIRLDEDVKSAYPNVAYSFIGPSMVLALRAFLDWDLMDVSKIWLPVMTFGAIGSLAIYLAVRELRQKITSLLPLLLFIFVYSYGVILSFNVIWDTSEAESYRATILSKRISGGDYTAYYFNLSPWGPRSEAEEVDVGESRYEKGVVGEPVTVLVRKGKFDIPWFFVL